MFLRIIIFAVFPESLDKIRLILQSNWLQTPVEQQTNILRVNKHVSISFMLKNCRENVPLKLTVQVEEPDGSLVNPNREKLLVRKSVNKKNFCHRTFIMRPHSAYLCFFLPPPSKNLPHSLIRSNFSYFGDIYLFSCFPSSKSTRILLPS